MCYQNRWEWNKMHVFIFSWSSDKIQRFHVSPWWETKMQLLDTLLFNKCFGWVILAAGCTLKFYLPGGRLEISHKGFAGGLALIVIISAKPQPTWINNSTRYTPVTGSWKLHMFIILFLSTKFDLIWCNPTILECSCLCYSCNYFWKKPCNTNVMKLKILREDCRV